MPEPTPVLKASGTSVTSNRTDATITANSSINSSASASKSKDGAWEFPCLVFILLLAFLLRIYGINFGLPNLYYWDEPTVVNRAVRFGSGDLNPHFFYYPALYMYLLFGVTGGVFLFGKLTGHYHGVSDFAAEYFVDPSRVYLGARLATACMGTICVLLTYLIGKRYFDRRVGVIGALFLAVATMHGGHSHIGITDVPHAMFILAAYLPMYNLLCRGRRKDYVYTGLLIGLGAATKYLAILLVPSLLLACWLSLNRGRQGQMHVEGEPGNDRGQDEATPGRSSLQSSEQLERDVAGRGHRSVLGSLGLAFLAILIGFFVGTPYNLINLKAFLADFQEQNSLLQLGHGTSYAMFLQSVLPADVGLPILITCIVGIVLLVWRRRPADILFVLFPVFYFVFVARYPKSYPRYMITEDPFIGLLAGFALIRAMDGLVHRLKAITLRRMVKTVFACLALWMALPCAWKMLRWDALMSNTPDPRNHLQRWIEQNVPSGSVICLQSVYGKTFYNVPLLTDLRMQKIEENIPTRGRMGKVRSGVLETLRKRPIYREVVWNEGHPTLAEMDRQGVEYVVISDLNDTGLPEVSASIKAVTDDMEHRSHERRFTVYRFSPPPDAAEISDNMPITYPHLTVYRLR